MQQFSLPKDLKFCKQLLKNEKLHFISLVNSKRIPLRRIPEVIYFYFNASIEF
jgi:hypothetical protein